MYSTPFIINEDGNTEHLYRLSFEDSGFNEAWLQNMLFENPQSLPLGEIDAAYQEICPLCTEMNTGAGPIDIVYMTPHGRLIVVETKLWRNPEARRKVIGQILDYAKELVHWSYADLQRQVRRRRKDTKENTPYELVSKRFPDIDEARFVDGVTQSLEKGDFKLVIAGDGIRKDAHAIVEFLQDVGRFILAMIETAVYKHRTKDLLVIQPRTLVRTQVLERAVKDKPDFPTQEENVTHQEAFRQQYFEFWKSFLDSLTLDDPDQPFANPARTGNITFPLPPSGSVAWITVFFYQANKEFGCYIRLNNKPSGKALYHALVEKRHDIERDLPFEVEWDDEKRIIQRTRTVNSEWPPLQDETVVAFFQETVNAMVNTFRPALENLLKE